MIEGLFLRLAVILTLVLLLGIMNAGRRGSRNAQCYPCVECGYELLPAASKCPNCRQPQPLRGWAGRRERMWRS